MAIPEIVPSTAEVVVPAVLSESAARPSSSLRRRVMGLALPAIGENLLHTALGIVPIPFWWQASASSPWQALVRR